MINPQKAVEWYKGQYNTLGESDYDIYEKLKNIYTKDKNGVNYEYPENPYKPRITQPIPTEQELNEKANPGFFEKILTANLSEAYAEDGNWWGEAYNKSIAGTIYQIMHGEAKYEESGIDRAWYDEAGQFFVGLVSPIDVLTFFGSSAIGGAAAKTIASGPLRNMATKGFSQMLQKSGANRATRQAMAGGFHNYLARGAGIESGFSLATYGAAGGALQDAAQQSSEIKQGVRNEMDYLQTTWNATKHGASSLALGAAAGYVTKGLMAPKFAKAKMASDVSFANKVTKLTMNPAGQVVAEGTLFGTGQLAERALMGEKVDMDDWLSSIFMNTAIVGGLRASTKPLRIGQGDVERYTKAKKEFYGDIFEKAGFTTKKDPLSKTHDLLDIGERGEISSRYEKLKNIENELTAAGVATPEALIKEKMLIEAEARDVLIAMPEFSKNLEKYNKNLSKIDDISKLGSRKERAKTRAGLLKEFGYINNTLYAIYKEMRAGIDKFFTADELSTKEKRTVIEKQLDKKIKSLEDVNEMVNLGALNDPGAAKKMRTKFADSFDVSVKEVKNKEGDIIGYEPILTTPKGNKIETGVRTKDFNEALTVGEGLKKTYKQELLKQRDPLKKETTEGVKLDKETLEGLPEFESPGIEYVVTSKDKAIEAKDTFTEISDPSKPFVESKGIGKDLADIKNMLVETRNVGDMNIKQFQYDKLVKEYNDFIRTDKPRKKSDYDIKKDIFESGQTKHILKGLVGKDPVDIVTAYKMAEYLYSQTLGTSPKKNTKTAIKIIGYLNSEGKNFYQLSGMEIAQLIKNGIPSYKTSYVSDGKKITKNISSVNLLTSSGVATISQLNKVARSLDFISGDKSLMTEATVKGFNKTLNESRGKNVKPAKEGIRRHAIEKGKQLSEQTNDRGYQIAAELAAKYGFRDSEINKITPDVVKQLLKKDGNDYYFDMGPNVRKFKTPERIVWIDSPLAELLMNYTGDLSSGKGKYVTRLGQSFNKDFIANEKSKFTDTRRRMQTKGGEKLSGPEYREMNFLLGHDLSAIKQIYDVPTKSNIIASQKALHKKLGSPIENVKFKEGASKGPFKMGFDPARERFLDTWAAKDKLSPGQLQQIKLGKGILGMFIDAAEGAILLAKDRFQPTDFFHEKFHKVKAYARDVNDVKLLKSLSRLEQLAKNTPEYKQWKSKKQNKNRDMEEFTADVTGDKAQAISFAPNVFAKIKQAIQQVVSRIKTIVGVGNFNDYANVMAKRLTQKLDTTGVQFTGGKAKFKISDASFDSPNKYKNAINRQIRNVVKEYNVSGKDFIEYVASTAEGINSKDYIIPKSINPNSKNYVQQIEKLNSFAKRLDEVLQGDLNQYINQKDAFKKLTLIGQIERAQLPVNITKAKQIKIVKDVYKSEDGNLFNLSTKDLQNYKEYVINQKNVESDKIGWNTKSEINNIIANTFEGPGKGLTKEATMFLGTSHKAIGKIGLKTMQEKLLTHESIQENNKAGLLYFNDNGLKVVGGNFMTREAKFSKMKDNMVVALDNNGEMLLALQKAKTEYGKRLPKGENKIINEAQSFFDKAVLPEWKETIRTRRDGKSFGDGLAKKNKDGSYKYLNTNTKEGKIAVLYIENIQKGFGKEKFESALRQNTNQAEFEFLMKNSDIKFFEDGIYITRSITAGAKRALHLKEGAKSRAIINIAQSIAARRAKEKYGKNYTKEQLSKELEMSMLVAEQRYQDALFFNPSKISIKYLKERYELQDLYVENEKGKLIRTYEHQFDRTVNPYVAGMAKFYATLEMFPEAIQGMKPGNGINQVFKNLKSELKGVKEKEINWVQDVVQKQLGTDKSAAPYELSYRTLEATARIVAKLGLSFPTAGLKNIVTGTTQTVFAHRVRDIAQGFALVLTKDAEVYKRALDSNAFSIGNILYEGRNLADRALDATAFKAGFMKPTEKFNRLLAIASSIAEQKRLLNNISAHPKNSKIYNRSVDRLKSFYFLNDKEIGIRRKYGDSKEVKADNSLSNLDKIKLMRNVENINNKMNLYSHVNTQGSSADLFMPKFAGAEGIRPLTLFKRMAYAATDNTQNNIRESIRNRNLMKPVMGLAATYVSGSVMMGVYKALLNTDMPKENSDWWTRFKTTMWKGELFGIMSEVVSPFDTGFQQTLEPAIYNTISTMVMEIGQLADGKSNFSQFGENIMKGTFSGYSNALKIKERKFNKLNSNRIRISKLYRDFMEEKGKPMPEEMQKNELSPYYKDFKDSFYLQGKEEFAEHFFATFFAIAHDRVRFGRSMDVAFKEAESMIKGKLRQLNPNKGSLYKSSKKGKRNSLEFIKWLQQSKDAKELTMTLFESESEYRKRLIEFMKHLPVYARKHNIKNFYDDHDWSVEQGF